MIFDLPDYIYIFLLVLIGALSYFLFWTTRLWWLSYRLKGLNVPVFELLSNTVLALEAHKYFPQKKLVMEQEPQKFTFSPISGIPPSNDNNIQPKSIPLTWYRMDTVAINDPGRLELANLIETTLIVVYDPDCLTQSFILEGTRVLKSSPGVDPTLIEVLSFGQLVSELTLLKDNTETTIKYTPNPPKAPDPKLKETLDLPSLFQNLINGLETLE